MPIDIGISNSIKGSDGTGTGAGGSGGSIPGPPLNFLLQQDSFKIVLQDGTGSLLIQ